MFRIQAGHMSRPPSPNLPQPTHVPLTLRTTLTPSQNAPPPPLPRGQSSTSSNTSAPKPIPADKFNKALKLYTQYYMAKRLDQLAQQPQSAVETSNSNLNIPQPARARSLTSGSSRAYTPSASNSEYDGVTDISTVISFGEESYASGPRGSEKVNYNGEVVKQRVRKPLSPIARSKAALIRHLKSCTSCSTRRVACDLEHHDIASLEQARKKRARARQNALSVQQNRSAISGSPANGSGPNNAAQAGSTTGQNELIFGIGQQDELVANPSSTPAPADPLSPGASDILSDIPSFHTVQAPNNDVAIPFNNMNQSPVSSSNNDIPLGVYRNYLFRCMHFEMRCQGGYDTPEDLQAHFESHFDFSRISPAERYICSNCLHMSPFLAGTCNACGYEGTVEMWIYGGAINVPTFQRYGPDGSDGLEFFNNDSAPYVPGNSNNIGFGFDGGMGNGNGNGNFTAGWNNNTFYQDQDQHNADFNAPGSQGGDETPRSGGYPYPGNWAVRTARYRYGKALHHKALSLTLVFLVALMLLLQSERLSLWLSTHFNKERSFPSHTLLECHRLPVVGFVGVLASFAICWRIKRLGYQRARGRRCCPQRCPLHDLPTMALQHRKMAANSFVRGGLFS